MTRPVVGLLSCDHLPVVQVAGDYDALFGELLEPCGVELRAWSLIDGHVPASIDECDGWVVGGSRHSVNDDLPWMDTLVELVRAAHEVERPMVGVCFGHQAIARSLGGVVEQAAVGLQAGAIEYRWAAGGGFRLIAMHQDQVTQPPPDAEVLAAGDDCPVAVFSIGDHLLGVQPHPEFDAAVSAALVETRRPTLGDAWADDRRATLGAGLDRRRWARWMTDVLVERRMPTPPRTTSDRTTRP